MQFFSIANTLSTTHPESFKDRHSLTLFQLTAKQTQTMSTPVSALDLFRRDRLQIYKLESAGYFEYK